MIYKNKWYIGENKPEKLRIKGLRPLFPEAHLTVGSGCVSLAQGEQSLTSEYIRHCFLLLYDNLIFVLFLLKLDLSSGVSI